MKRQIKQLEKLLLHSATLVLCCEGLHSVSTTAQLCMMSPGQQYSTSRVTISGNKVQGRGMYLSYATPFILFATGYDLFHLYILNFISYHKKVHRNLKVALCKELGMTRTNYFLEGRELPRPSHCPYHPNPSSPTTTSHQHHGSNVNAQGLRNLRATEVTYYTIMG